MRVFKSVKDKTSIFPMVESTCGGGLIAGPGFHIIGAEVILYEVPHPKGAHVYGSRCVLVESPSLVGLHYMVIHEFTREIDPLTLLSMQAE